MINGSPLFTGTSEQNQLEKIYWQLGTPTEATFPGVSKLPEWVEPTISRPACSISELVPKLDANGVDLLAQMLVFDPVGRISAMDARKHPFFSDLPDALKKVGADMS